MHVRAEAPRVAGEGCAQGGQALVLRCEQVTGMATWHCELLKLQTRFRWAMVESVTSSSIMGAPRRVWCSLRKRP